MSNCFCEFNGRQFITVAKCVFTNVKFIIDSISNGIYIIYAINLYIINKL